MSKKELSAKTDSLIQARVKTAIRDMSAYSVPHVDTKVRLDGNESPFPLPSELNTKLSAELAALEVNRYPDPESEGVRTRLSRICDFPVEGILLGNGSDELIGILITTFAGGTSRIHIPTPTFSMYAISGAAQGMEVIETSLDSEFDLDLDEMISAIENNDPDLIFLASPNNPTGNMYSTDRIKRIIDKSRGIVVVDEAYSDFSGYTFLPMVKEHENLIVLRTFSKIGFAGLRLGILYGAPELVNEINKVRYPYNINSLSQKVAELVLDNHDFVLENIQLITKERGRVFKTMREIEGVYLYESDANFIFFRAPDADKLFDGLTKRDVLIRNFNRPGRLRNCMRVTIGTPEENDTFLQALRSALSSES